MELDLICILYFQFKTGLKRAKHKKIVHLRLLRLRIISNEYDFSYNLKDSKRTQAQLLRIYTIYLAGIQAEITAWSLTQESQEDMDEDDLECFQVLLIALTAVVDSTLSVKQNLLHFIKD